MANYFSKSIFLFFSLVVIVCGIYPLALWIIAQSAFPFQANGSLLLTSDNKPIGSKLIAQPFTKQAYFQPRPSATVYDAAASAASSLAASNNALRDRVARTIELLVKYHNGRSVGPDIPGDLVTTSASGLDPHITLQNAMYQLDRVSSAWAAQLKRNKDEVLKEINQVLQLNSRSPLGGLAGEKFINVLEVNFELYKRYGSPSEKAEQ